jgi:hypothetical protein
MRSPHHALTTASALGGLKRKEVVLATRCECSRNKWEDDKGVEEWYTCNEAMEGPTLGPTLGPGLRQQVRRSDFPQNPGREKEERRTMGHSTQMGTEIYAGLGVKGDSVLSPLQFT